MLNSKNLRNPLMKLLILAFSLFLTDLSLHAQRIILTKTAHKANLKAINAKLKSIQMKMYVKRSPNYYYVYTEDYKTSTQAVEQLKRVQTIFPGAKLEKKKIQKNRNWIVGFGIGNSSTSGDIGGNTPFKESGNSYSLKAGYFFQPYFLSTLSFSSSTVEKTTLSNTYLTLDYYYKLTKNSNIFIGLAAGYSSLLMDFEKSVPSGSALYGAQAGISYDLFGQIPLSLTYRSILLDHTIFFSSETQTVDINTKIQNTIEIGIAYRF